MPHTPPPWLKDHIQEGVVRIIGAADGDGLATLICVVAGRNVHSDASLISECPTLAQIARVSLDLATSFELGLSELRRVVSVEREYRLVLPMLRRVRDHRAALQDVLARAEAI